MKVLLALCFFVALTAAQDAFIASNVLLMDQVPGGQGRAYRATIQYWPSSQLIYYTIAYSSGTTTGSFLILEDFAKGLRYVQCSETCNVEPLNRQFFDLSSAQGETAISYPDYVRTFLIDSGTAIGSLATAPSLPSLCVASSVATSSSSACLPYGLSCGTSCICVGCTDGEDCTISDTCGVSDNQLTCTGEWGCAGGATLIKLNRDHGGGSVAVAVSLGVALGVGIPVAVLLLLLLLLLLFLLPLLASRKRRRPRAAPAATAVPVTAVPVARAVPVATAAPIVNPYYSTVPAAGVAPTATTTTYMPAATSIPVETATGVAAPLD